MNRYSNKTVNILRSKTAILTCVCFFLLLAAMPCQAQDEDLDMFEKMQNHIIKVSDQVKSSVVHIEVVSKQNEQHRKGMGSGLIITKDGQIITNYHVIDRAQMITVILDDKTKHEAKVVRRDQQTDLAIIKIDAKQTFKPATFVDSDKVQVGEWVIAIGNPYGFDRTVSFGIVSGKGRFIPGADNGVPLINDFIQTDALIDPGNSGGPLVNMKGEILGINSIGVGRGQGFTIPANIVKEIINRTEVEGRIQRGWLGAFLQPFSEEYAQYLGQPDLRGVMVSDLIPAGPGAKAGILSGDIITKFGNNPVTSTNEEGLNRFILMVTGLEPGKQVDVELNRNGKKIVKKVTLGTQPPVQAAEAETDYGFTAKEITQANMQEYRLDSNKGVLVSYVTKGSAAYDADISVGDVIVKIENNSVSNLNDFKKAINSLGKRDKFLVTVRRGRIMRYSLVDLSPYKDKTDDKK